MLKQISETNHQATCVGCGSRASVGSIKEYEGQTLCADCLVINRRFDSAEASLESYLAPWIKAYGIQGLEVADLLELRAHSYRS